MRTRQLDDNVGLGRELAGCFGVWMLGKRVCLTQTGNSGRQAYVGRRRLRSGKEVQQVFMPAHTVSKTPCPPGSLCTHRCPDIPVTHIPLVVHPNGCFRGAFWPCPPPIPLPWDLPQACGPAEGARLFHGSCCSALKPSPTPLFEPCIAFDSHHPLLKLSHPLTSVVFPPTSLGWLLCFLAGLLFVGGPWASSVAIAPPNSALST